MITVRNEFETVPAWEHLAGCSLGSWTVRATTLELIKVLDTTTQSDPVPYLKELAGLGDDLKQDMYDLQEDIVSELNEYMPMPAYCHVALNDNEWQVIPYIDEELPRLEDVPEEYQEGHILQISDHGNVTCYEWQQCPAGCHGEYKEIWAMV